MSIQYVVYAAVGIGEIQQILKLFLLTPWQRLQPARALLVQVQ